MLDSLPLWLQRKCLVILCRICGDRALLPSSVQISLCHNRMNAPLYHDGFTEAWKGEHQGREVAVKVVYVTIDPAEITKVGSCILLKSVCLADIDHAEVL